MNKTNLKHQPLQITITSLFILITIVLGAVLTLQNYRKTSDIILGSADKLYTQFAKEIYLDFEMTYSPLTAALQLIGQSAIVDTKTLEQRLEHLGTFKTLLENTPSSYEAVIAFPDADVFMAALLNDELKRAYYRAPEAATLLVLSVDTSDDGERTLTSIFFNNDLVEISRTVEPTDFDPFSRPWYVQATDRPSATRPYLFHGINIVGLAAMVKATKPGVVVSMGITLDSLAGKISGYQITPRSEVALINAEGETFAYRDSRNIIIESNNDQTRLATMDQLDSDVLRYLSKHIKAAEQNLDFEFNGERWVGSTRIIGRPGGVDLYALMISPVDELLSDAVAIRWQSLITTLIVILLVLPVIWYAARKISLPLKSLAGETQRLARFEFSQIKRVPSHIREVEELDVAINMMSTTINKFINLINSLAGEQNLDALLNSITHETRLISRADGALTYLYDETEDLMKASVLYADSDEPQPTDALPVLSMEDCKQLLGGQGSLTTQLVQLDRNSDGLLTPLLDIFDSPSLQVLVIPLANRNQELIGLLSFVFRQDKEIAGDSDDARIAFVEALSGFAAVTLESRQMLHMQEALLDAFIKLIAGAIDAKSPYTGGHCQRVPEITLLLAQAACDSDDPRFRDFSLGDKEWKALEIACWLHDCGKVTTPEYVVDKSTKLETIYDRIHEVRMRFEVLKRDAIIRYWQQLSEGGEEQVLKDELDNELQTLDDEFAFIAECNEGGEFMAEDKIERLNRIAERTWTRTLDDRAGISWEEMGRKNRTEQQELPVEEQLLADKPEHIIERAESERMPDDNPWNFRLDTPEHKYNRGELYNLSIARGTLSREERFKINEHMVQTIVMLTKLPYPKHMKDVPDIAGCHHETLDGKGYPRRLVKEQIPFTGRMMAIADIFEALTASDRPYKKAKKLSEAIRIMGFMKKDSHIDPDLFELFLTSGTYLQYAEKFLDPEQIDEVDIQAYIEN